jgi:hypothetical protein
MITTPRTLGVLAAGAAASALVVAGNAAAGRLGVSSSACKAGVTTFGGAQARVFCGSAKATVTLAGKTVHFTEGTCQRTSQFLSVNIGTVVLGQTSKKQPDYFGLDVGKTPGSTSKPAAADGHYTGGTVAIVSGGTSYLVRGNTVKITLTGGRTKCTISGSLLIPSGSVSGSFSC